MPGPAGARMRKTRTGKPATGLRAGMTMVMGTTCKVCH